MTSRRITITVPAFIKDALYNDVKYTCIHAGRRSGKTYNSAQWLVEMLLCNGGKSGLWVDVTQRNIIKYVDKYFKKILGDVWQICKYDKQGHEITLPNKSYLDFSSSERPQNMEGFEYDYVVLNEAGIILRKPELWLNTLAPMCRRAKVKIVGTPKGKNYFYELSNNCNISKDWATYHFKASDSPFWELYELDEARRLNPEDIYLQEYEGRFLSVTSNIICKRTLKESWRDDDDIPYTIKSDFILKQLGGKGYFWLAMDGGMHTTHSAILLGYYNRDYNRDILLKEFYNVSKIDGLKEVALQVIDFCHYHKLELKGLRMFGDPAIKNFGDNEPVEELFGCRINMLEDFQNSEESRLKGIFTNRKKRRLSRLADEIIATRSDYKPSIIILKDNKQGKFGWGCPETYDGLFNGMFRFEIKQVRNTQVIMDDLEQIAPITDLCDAYSYYLLCTRYNHKVGNSANQKLTVLS